MLKEAKRPTLHLRQEKPTRSRGESGGGPAAREANSTFAKAWNQSAKGTRRDGVHRVNAAEG